MSLAGQLNRQGTKTVVVLTDCPPGLIKEYANYSGKKVPLYAENMEAEIINIVRYYDIDLIHLHTISLMPLTLRLAGYFRIPFGITLHERAPLQNYRTGLSRSAFTLTPNPVLFHGLKEMGLPVVFVPDGIDLECYRPAPKNAFTITFIGDKGLFNDNSYLALQKAAVIAGVPLDIICYEKLQIVKGTYHGWHPGRNRLLERSQVAVGSRRSLLEGLACGNAALILSKKYYGIMEENSPCYSPYPDPTLQKGLEACYKDILLDLTRLLKDRTGLVKLQQWGRKYVREYHDLRLTAEMTERIYRHKTGK